MFAIEQRMTMWEKPSFEELAMNAEIGAYQPDDWDGERQADPWLSDTWEAIAESDPALPAAVNHG